MAYSCSLMICGFPFPTASYPRDGVSFIAGFLVHAPENFARQVDGVVLVEPLDDCFDQAAEHAFGDGFGDTDDFYSTFFSENSLIKRAFFLVAGETRELP